MNDSCTRARIFRAKRMVPGGSGRGGVRGGGSGGAPAGVRPRVPAMVKREVAESREADEDGAEDTTRLQYRGFDKSKLNASRKQQRKEARVSKKQHKAEHQASDGPRAAAAALRAELPRARALAAERERALCCCRVRIQRFG